VKVKALLPTKTSASAEAVAFALVGEDKDLLAGRHASQKVRMPPLTDDRRKLMELTKSPGFYVVRPLSSIKDDRAQ